MDTISSALLLGQSTTSSLERQAKAVSRASEENVIRIDSQIRDLLRLREQERGLITALKLVVAPIKKLPAELLVEIFSHSMEWPYIESALRLCHVCAHWRQIASTVPALWVGPFTINPKKSSSDEYLAIAKTFLERSAPLPIPIHITASHPPLLVDFLYSLASRWRSLTLNDAPLSQLRQLPLTALESLEEVTLAGRHGIQSYEPRIMLFLAAPRLHTVTLAVSHMSHFPMPWSQLAHLCIRQSSPQTCLDILLQCANAVTAKFNGMHSWTQPLPTAPTVVLPRLEKLQVGFVLSEGHHVMSFFTRLALPRLTELELCLDLGDIWSSPDFTPFQRRAPNITHMNFRACSFSPQQLICVLLDAPRLVELELACCFGCFDDTVLEALWYSENDAVHTTPRLCKLRVEIAGYSFQEDVLLGMMQSRWWSDVALANLPLPPPVARWNSIDIWRGDDDDPEHELTQGFKRQMEIFRLEGLRVDIT
ncbi:hypothetical protein C8F04DRAFT_1064448 [Mycena alexandri]|uniref:F-box domain-containing protein n=1 Tax=Mycena alexandri TaxID=1745969 RepID=A0AAD6TH45_9AGAR|nr:hypothetical protein C8F04DRAFT_1064448 [Mycena alexandri]